MSEFIMTVGLPGCGKTTWAKKQNCAVVSSDDVRAHLYGRAEIQGKAEDVFAVMRKRTVKLLRSGESVVYDATNMSGKKRRHTLEWVKAVDEATARCVVFVTPIEVCKARNATRERIVPDHVFNKMLRAYNVPQYFEGWDKIEIVWDTAPGQWEYPPAVSDAALMEFDQHNSYHNMTLGAHMLAAEKYLLDKAADPEGGLSDEETAEYKYLAGIAAYHDIGKYYTRDFHDTRGNDTEFAHYYGHENYGAYIMLLSFLESYERHEGDFPDDYTDVALKSAGLVNWHMRPYVWEKSDGARERDRAYIGDDMYRQLLILNEADVAAHG